MKSSTVSIIEKGFILPLFSLVLGISMPSISYGLVDMRNANYSETWIDLDISGAGYNLKVQRTYNSRSLFNGMFGFGWCSDFETSLDVTVDNTLKLTQCGDGFETVYMPANGSVDPKDSVSKIITKLKSSNSRLTQNYLKNLSQKLMDDRRLRDKYSEELGLEGKTGKSLYLANGRGPDSIELKDNHYIRKLPGGEIQEFDATGRLTELKDANDNYIKFSYNSEGLSSVTDNTGKKLTFSYYSNKKVKKIVGPNNTNVSYEFKNQNDLYMVKNAWGNAYKYAYDELHNLVDIQFPDKTNKKLSYDVNKDWVTSFTDRDGCREEYKYELSKKDPKNHYWSTVLKKCKGKIVSRGHYEFWYKTNPKKGDVYLYRVLTKQNGNTNDVVYHPDFAKPISVTQNGKTVRYDYDSKTGLLSSRKEKGSLVKFEYDNTCKKVSKVRAGKLVTVFNYDQDCNLSLAKNTKGQVVSLKYDRHGRIASLIDQAKKRVNITYDERFSKPKRVERPGIGTIEVQYKSSGEVDKVESPNGALVAKQVASSFNTLLEIVEPAGIDLGI